MTLFPRGRMDVHPGRLAANRSRERLLGESPEGVILSARILSFKQLEFLLHGQTGARRLISDLGRDMMFEKAVRAEAAHLGWARTASPLALQRLSRRVWKIVDGIRAAGLSRDDFQQAAADALPDRIAGALGRIRTAYEAGLEKAGFTDRTGQRQRLLERLNRGAGLPLLHDIQCLRFLGLRRMTPFQADLVKALGRVVPRVVIFLDCPEWVLSADPAAIPHWSGNPMAETLSLIESMEKLGDREGGLEIKYTDGGPQRPADLQRVYDYLFRPAPGDPPPEPPQNIQVLAAPGRYAEVEEIGRRIRGLIDRGAPAERIAIAVRDLGLYGSLIEDVFRRFNMPFYFRRGAPLAVQPVVQSFLNLLRLADFHFDRRRVLDVLDSPYLDLGFDLPAAQAAELSARAGVTDERAGGGWSENLDRLAASEGSLTRDIDKLKQNINELQNVISATNKSAPLVEHIRNYRALLKRVGMERCILAGDREYLPRDIMAWSGLRACLDDIERGASESGTAGERHPADEAMTVLLSALRERNIGQEGDPGFGVMVLNVFDLHGLDFDYVFCLGLNENEFPRTGSEGSLLTDDQMRDLNKRTGRLVFATGGQEYRREELAFHQSLAAAGQGLVMSYSRTDAQGRMRLASSLVDAVLRLWPEGELEVLKVTGETVPKWDQVLTREELLGRLALDLLAGETKEPGLGLEIMAALNRRPEEKRSWSAILRRLAIERRRLRGETGVFSGMVGPDPLVPWLASLRKHQRYPVISPSFLESYAQCPFAFWAKNVLKLDPPPLPGDDVRPIDEGLIIHRILCRFMTRCREEGLLPLQGRSEEEALLSSISREVWREAEAAMAVGRAPLWRSRRRILENLLRRWWQHESAWADDLIPTHFEWEFGPFSKTKPRAEAFVPFLSGGGLYFRGRVDRIDVSVQKARVLDYKNSGRRAQYRKLLQDEEVGRTSFQAPVYQAAAAEALGRPSQSGWVILQNLGERPPDLSAATDSALFATDPDQRREMSGEGRDNFFNLVESTWQRLAGGAFPPNPDSSFCRYCDFRTGCRSVAPQENGADES